MEVKRKTSLVVTTISKVNNALTALAKGCQENDITFIVIGDKSSPADFNLPGSVYYSLPDQKRLSSNTSRIAKVGSYSRKNIGYLLAMLDSSEIILETDDDNIPYPEFFNVRSMHPEGCAFIDYGWINAYAYFSGEKIWPRGFPLSKINEPNLDRNIALPSNHLCPIQQGLADGNPDVDAIYRMTGKLPVTFKNGENIILAGTSRCPFNSQNTMFYKPAFPLLYLPTTCSFRMTDIYRSFVAQRICQSQATSWGILFHSATVRQERNEHNLMDDFAQEVDGYLYADKIVSRLATLTLKSGPEYLCNNLMLCYLELVALGVVHESEIDYLTAWISDINNILK